MRELIARLRDISAVPEEGGLSALVGRLLTTLSEESPEYRPYDRSSIPGGLVYLDPGTPTVVLPDIHARPGLVATAINVELVPGVPILEALLAGDAQLVCVGDYFHGEARVRRRWSAAFKEYCDGFRTHSAMDEEMAESLSVLMMLAALKVSAPSAVHLLKGNHENVANESGSGNHPFVKFAHESAMVFEYMRMIYGMAMLGAVYYAEKRLPLLAVGGRYVISHAEPARLFSRDEVVGYRDSDEVVHGLTWTDNDEAEPDAVERMIDYYLPEERRDGARYFGGHRPVPGLYKLRAGGRYVQFHNPSRYVVAVLWPDRNPDPEQDIIDLGPNQDADDAPNSG